MLPPSSPKVGEVRGARIHLVWSPVDRDRRQDSMVWKKAICTCTLAPIGTLNRCITSGPESGPWTVASDCAPAITQSTTTSSPNHLTAATTYPARQGFDPISRHTSSAVFQLAVRHSFTADYVIRFRKDLEPSSAVALRAGTSSTSSMTALSMTGEGVPTHFLAHIGLQVLQGPRVRLHHGPFPRIAFKPVDNRLEVPFDPG
ncbi:hypothetical protein EDB87DRAFT_1577780 [Lactarius vividus]|nr:hypothetical protein EDB87DRAFT_1577780 [Lactarius vividus]